MILEGIYKSTEIKTSSLRSVELNFTLLNNITKNINLGFLTFIFEGKKSTPLYGAATQPAGHFTGAFAAGGLEVVVAVFVFLAAAT